MLKCEIVRNKELKVEASGATVDIATEAAAVVYRVYQMLQKQDPKSAESFKKRIQKAFHPSSPLWKG